MSTESYQIFVVFESVVPTDILSGLLNPDPVNVCKEAVSNLKEVIEAATEAVFVSKEAVCANKLAVWSFVEAESAKRAATSVLVKVPLKDPVNDPVADDAVIWVLSILFVNVVPLALIFPWT